LQPRAPTERAALPPIVVADGDIATTRLVARELEAVYPQVEIRIPDTLFGAHFEGRPVVISRLCHPSYGWLPEYLAERGVAYAYFLDDNFWELTPEVDVHLAAFFNHPAVIATLEHFVRAARRVIVWSQRLRDYLAERFPDVEVVRVAPGFDTTVPRRLLAAASTREKAHDGVIRVGYPTTRRPGVASLLTTIVKHVAAQRAGAVKFEFVGWMPDALAQIPHVTLFPHIDDYGRYLEFVISRRWDVGIAPLTGGRFESFKTDIKYREYGGCRVPGIYSRVSPYVEVVSRGRTGLLSANDADAWIEALDTLLDAPSLRERIAAAAYDDVAEHRDLNVTGRRFAELVPANDAQRASA
jgi:glycosyltransferase involved in cell wall biosynthesis